MPGSALFLKAETPRTGPARTMTLPDFVAKSYAAYVRQPPENLVCRTVDAWLSDRGLSADLREAAGGAPRSVAGAGRDIASAGEAGPAGLRAAIG